MALQRVAYVLKIFPKLSETFIAGELAELRRRGLELRILSLLPPRDEIKHDFIRRARLEELACYQPSDFLSVLAQFRPQFLHAHFATEPTAVAHELASQLRLPFTFTCHGYDIYRKPPPDFLARAKAASAVVTVSKANADWIARRYGVDSAHIRVIPCGVDTSRFRPKATAVKASTPLVLAVARLVPVKNLGLLAQACGLLRERGLRFRCVIIGEGSCRAELETLRSELHLEKFLKMPGAAQQSEILRLWQRAAIGVLTSSSEGMPVCLMEAAACGVPAVATAVGGVPELVQDGVTGLLSPSGDAKGLAANLEKLLRAPIIRQRMGTTARQRAETRFSVVHQTDQLLGLWSGVLDACPSATETSAANRPAVDFAG